VKRRLESRVFLIAARLLAGDDRVLPRASADHPAHRDNAPLVVDVPLLERCVALGGGGRLALGQARVAYRDRGELPLVRGEGVVGPVDVQRGELGDVDFQCLRQAGVTDALITEIVCNIALSIFTNYFNSVARTEIDFPLLKPGADAPARS